ncbi:MAG: DUF2202 domain-containing protein [bacterium]
MTQKTIYAIAISGVALTTILASGLVVCTYAQGGRFANSNSSNNSTKNNQSAGNQDNQNQSNAPQEHDLQSITSLPNEDLSEDEKSAILYMSEEEKLARDVYQTLGDKYNLNIFKNIVQSEQKHTDSVKVLIDKYSISDPVTSNETGIFTNPDLQKLFTDLVAKGNQNQLEALIVGATTEDLDITDLNSRLSQTDNADIKLVFQNLLKGSGNHLRAFVKNIENQGGSYSPQFLSQVEYNTILSATNSEQSGNQQKIGGRGRNRN